MWYNMGAFCFGMVALLLCPALGSTAELLLFDLTNGLDPGLLQTADARFERVGAALRIATGTQGRWPGVTLKAPQGRWNLEPFAEVAVNVLNKGRNPLELNLRVDNPGADGQNNCITVRTTIAPGQERTLRAALERTVPPALKEKLIGMRGYPLGYAERGIDPANITQLILFVGKPSAEHLFDISRIRAQGTAQPPPPPDRLFPMIDSFGQYMHRTWPGKTITAEDFARHRQAEEKDLAAHPGPTGWNRYGGWADGPKFEATGFFRVEKYKDRWWLVDPEGCLFWSHGPDCVRTSTGYTPISDRLYMFAELPPRDGPFGVFYGTGRNAPHGYYKDKAFDTFNFTGANLLRKYGPQWQQTAAELAHRRLRSWGMNTIANWSDPDIYLLRRTPYTATISARGKPLLGSEGYWGKFDDVFDPSFEQALRQAMAREKDRTAGDPWCIGYFVHNELSWGDEFSLAVAALRSPPEQPAKRAFLEDLQRKYQTIDKLNQAWGTRHASWEDLLRSTDPPDVKKAAEDLGAFYTRTAERYFQICRDSVKQVAPNQLYLGCRFAWSNPRAVIAAAKYCDVVSFNRYSRSVADLRMPPGCDKPMIIGEFHFGALDRGMFHPGLVRCADQQERAEAYKQYIRSALDNPAIVGAHWFQYGDQATTGRPDGENYQIGLLDICDTPYPETIAAVREIGYQMYSIRVR